NYLIKNYFFFRVISYLYAKYNLRFIIKLFSLKLKGEYDIAISFLDGINTDFIILSKAKYKKLFSIVQSNYWHYGQKTKYLKSYAGKLRAQFRYKKVDTVICVSESVKEGFIKFFGDSYNTKVIYSPIMISKLMQESQHPFKVDLERFNIVALGRLVPVKGYENLIKAVAVLQKQKQYKHPYLRIVGTGELFEPLSKLIKELGLQNNVELCGFVENPYPIILNSDLFVMTSYSEGLPTALCEAMILGKPVMVTNVSGCSEVVDNGKYGAICEPNVESIASKLEQILQDEDYRTELTEKSVERSQIFSDEHAMQQYYDLFES
ncbi:MAG: glycosyltransferase, partial [Cryomorphaceae bacterium]|nr:glycosyltransferase [Cryomorphaceae bacterium]